METKTNKMLSVTGFDEQSDVGSISWVSDDRVIVSMIDRVGPLDKPRATGFLFAVNVDGSKKSQLIPTPARPGKAVGRRATSQLVDMLPDDPKYVLMFVADSSYTTIYKMNVFSGRKTEYAKSNEAGATIQTDHNNVIRFYIDNDYDLDDDIYTRKLYYRDSDEDDWQLHRTIVDKKARKLGYSAFELISFTTDNKRVFIETDDAIEEYDPITKKYKTLVAFNDDADVIGNIYSTDFNRKELIGVKRMPGNIETTYFGDNPDIALRKSFSAAFPGKEVSLSGKTKDGSLMLIYVYSDKIAGEYYLFDAKARSLSFLLSTAPQRNEKQLAEMKPFSFIARDGLEIRGYLTLPKGKSKNLPLVQVVHGGPYGVTDDWRYNDEAQFFANQGYAVIQVNYRGSGGRGNRFQFDHYLKMGKFSRAI